MRNGKSLPDAIHGKLELLGNEGKKRARKED